MNNSNKEFGDFQTPEHLAVKVVSLVSNLFGTPDVVIEPNAGLGTFLKASVEHWGKKAIYRGYEIKKEYVELAKNKLNGYGVDIFCSDFFNEDWENNLSQYGASKVLVIGNPPWVTNSDLGLLRSDNLPVKTNFQGLCGLDALMGKSNFDIAEWMLIRLVESLPSEGAVAMLCKTMTARKVLTYFWRNNEGREKTFLFQVDAKKEFNVSVDACLFFVTGKHDIKRIAISYADLDIASAKKNFGFTEGCLISDIDLYQEYKSLDKGSKAYVWRSGVKHDAAKVMEFACEGDKLINGFGETVALEKDYIFPLLKSSDIGNGRIDVRKSVLVTQSHPKEDTTIIKQKAPKTWEYLMRHASLLDGRKSSIYKNRSRFSVFGIGDYSFSRWKIAISGLYKKIYFIIVPPHHSRPVMLDDTCYSISCQSKEEAELLHSLLSSDMAINFLKSLIFFDSKRPVTIDILRRISFLELARAQGKMKDFEQYGKFFKEINKYSHQMLLPVEPKQKCKTSQCIEKITNR